MSKTNNCGFQCCSKCRGLELKCMRMCIGMFLWPMCGVDILKLSSLFIEPSRLCYKVVILPSISKPIMSVLLMTETCPVLTLTGPRTRNYYQRKCKNRSKSDYVIDTGPIQVRNRWPGSVTVVAWHGRSRDWCARGPGFESGGNYPF